MGKTIKGKKERKNPEALPLGHWQLSFARASKYISIIDTINTFTFFRV